MPWSRCCNVFGEQTKPCRSVCPVVSVVTYDCCVIRTVLKLRWFTTRWFVNVLSEKRQTVVTPTISLPNGYSIDKHSGRSFSKHSVNRYFLHAKEFSYTEALKTKAAWYGIMLNIAAVFRLNRNYRTSK